VNLATAKASIAAIDVLFSDHPKGLDFNFTPAAGSHGLCPWMNAPAFGRDVAPLGREEGCHGLCPWSSTYLPGLMISIGHL